MEILCSLIGPPVCVIDTRMRMELRPIIHRTIKMKTGNTREKAVIGV